MRHLQNPMKLEDPFQIEISFEVFEDLNEGIISSLAKSSLSLTKLDLRGRMGTGVCKN